MIYLLTSLNDYDLYLTVDKGNPISTDRFPIRITIRLFGFLNSILGKTTRGSCELLEANSSRSKLNGVVDLVRAPVHTLTGNPSRLNYDSDKYVNVNYF